ncbi:MAG: GntR family transcriptional regulator [Oscillospiraceae bacterium]|nr:GntR family transcriptional regulator [Oscillospiraceae bacterium]
MINLNFRDARPIYEQIKAGFRNLIATGAIAPGEKLPSVRELAVELAINPNTIQRAYRELEQEGVICSVPGKGSFASDSGDVFRAQREELFRKFDETAGELMQLGVTAGELRARLDREGNTHD